MQQQEKATGSQVRRHGGHRERIFTEPVMEVLIDQLGLQYYRIRDHLEKPQAVVTEIAEFINKKIPGLNLQPLQVYGRMINLQNSLRRYWESIAVGDYKKKPRYYEALCKVFGTDYNETGAIQGEDFINGDDELDGGSPNHITVELPEFFDANTLGSAHYTTTASTQSRTAAATSNGREDMWTSALTRVLLQSIEDCIDMLRSRADKYKAWKIIAGAVNAHCEAKPMTVYQIKVKVKRMMAAVRKYERQATRGQLFVDKPFYYDVVKTLFKKELRPYQNNAHCAVLDGAESFTARPPASALTVSMQTYMRKTTAMLQETIQIQKEMREEVRDYQSKLLQQFKTFNDTYRMVALNTINAGGSGGATGSSNKRRRLDDDTSEEYVEFEELIGDDQSDLEEGIVEQEEFDEMQVTHGQHEML